MLPNFLTSVKRAKTCSKNRLPYLQIFFHNFRNKRWNHYNFLFFTNNCKNYSTGCVYNL